MEPLDSKKLLSVIETAEWLVSCAELQQDAETKKEILDSAILQVRMAIMALKLKALQVEMEEPIDV